ncbi:MAG: hypothetical protein LBF13_00455 [Campylobacteraceae bacterium]|jgi:hypothetical protein|nr:hypothetical protein [Campylobacteraceae bacterium]
MSPQLLGAVIIAAVVIVIMIKQINKVTDKIDADLPVIEPTRLYANFAALVQEKIRAIRLDIDTPKEGAKFVLLEEVNTSEALEKLSDMIRKLVFFETMIGMKNGAQSTEAGLFEILNSLDNFIAASLVNGKELADEIREELAVSYDRLKNSYMIESM